MSQQDIMTIDQKIAVLRQYEEIAEDAKAKAEAIKDFIKQKMTDDGIDTLVTDEHIVKYLSILSSRFDTKRFKDEMGADAYKYYCKEVPSMKFTISD